MQNELMSERGDDFESADDTGPTETLGDFLSSEDLPVDSADGDTEGAEASEERTGKPKARGTEARSDEADDAAGPSESYSRLVLKQGRLSRDLTARNARVRELEGQLAQRTQATQEPADVIELVRYRLARDLGVQPSDPRVNEALFELSKDITLDHLGSAADVDPGLKRLREERGVERKRREERRQLEDRIARIEGERTAAVMQAQRSAAEAGVTQILERESERYGFLMAQGDVDPVQTVTDLALEAIRTGRVETPSTDKAATKLIRQLASNLDAHYRSMAEVLAGKLNPQGQKSSNGLRTGKTQTQATPARKQAPPKQTGAATRGGGGRGQPQARTEAPDDDEESLDSFMRAGYQAEQAARRGKRR